MRLVWGVEAGMMPGVEGGIGIATVSEGFDANELAAWTQTARLVLNLHESITRY